MHAWSRLSGFPDTPLLTGPTWHSVLLRWMSVMPGIALVLSPDGDPLLLGVRRVPPASRLPGLAGWDALQLLSLFRCARLLDVPRPDIPTLRKLPLPQLWPTLGQALAATRAMIASSGGYLLPPDATPASAGVGSLDAALGEVGGVITGASPNDASASSHALGSHASSRFEQGARVEGSVLLEPPAPPPPAHLVAAKLAGSRAKVAVSSAPTMHHRNPRNNPQ